MRTPRRFLIPPPLLTRREHEVLHGLAEGLTNKEIARLLCVSEQTIATHVKALFRKLEVHNRLLAVRAGEQRGLLSRAPRGTTPGHKPPHIQLVAPQKSPKQGRKLPYLGEDDPLAPAL